MAAGARSFPGTAFARPMMAAGETNEFCSEDRLMTRLMRPAWFVLLLCLSLPGFAGTDNAKVLYEKGADAEARQNYEQAYDYFKQAYALKPRDLKYRASYERIRFLRRCLARAPRTDCARCRQTRRGAVGIPEGARNRSFLFHRAAGTAAHAADDQGTG